MIYNFEILGDMDGYFPKCAWPFEIVPTKGDEINLTDIVPNTHKHYHLVLNTWYRVKFVKWEFEGVTVVIALLNEECA